MSAAAAVINSLRAVRIAVGAWQQKGRAIRLRGLGAGARFLGDDFFQLTAKLGVLCAKLAVQRSSCTANSTRNSLQCQSRLESWFLTALPKLAAHKQKFFAGMTPHKAEIGSEISQFLPFIARQSWQ
jgi:hypothetical protein